MNTDLDDEMHISKTPQIPKNENEIETNNHPQREIFSPTLQTAKVAVIPELDEENNQDSASKISMAQQSPINNTTRAGDSLKIIEEQE